ncbi:MAG TPA: MBL fold metallo-hydrolase [Salinarimonas sp.]|jgi:L-ascorbate metabolism protein UlaG (beta-lactamase superfamily)|nr:MBL fold metallo-hydrolase [Salinarimonas sp.]
MALSRALAALAAAALLSAPALAAPGCPGAVASRGLPIRLAALQADQVAITFVGHATFLIETPGGVRIATDYNDYVRPAVTPEVATMNKAHSTHFSAAPDPRIGHVLRGWSHEGGTARHDLQVGDVRIRNVPTNIRDSGGATDHDGNSIFVFEVADLCVAHLGHLHHRLTPGHLKDLGRIDVVLVPVDGSYTLSQDDMMEVLASLDAPVMIPMHFFGQATLQRFLARAGERWPVETAPGATLTVTRAGLPARPKVVVLQGR